MYDSMKLYGIISEFSQRHLCLVLHNKKQYTIIIHYNKNCDPCQTKFSMICIGMPIE